MTANSPSIVIEKAHLTLSKQRIFEDLSVTIKSNQCTCLLGPSGIGKSSLLKAIAGFFDKDQLTYSKFETDNNTPLGNQISYMAQDDLLLPWLSVLNNTKLGTLLRNTNIKSKASNAFLKNNQNKNTDNPNQNKKTTINNNRKNEPLSNEEAQSAINILKQVGLENAIRQKPGSLSGGMRQRAALARALYENRPILLMDEPFSSLDIARKKDLLKLTAEHIKGKTVLFVTHDPWEALSLADTILIMGGNPGEIVKRIEVEVGIKPRDTKTNEMHALLDELISYLESPNMDPGS